MKLRCMQDIEIETSILVSMNSCRGIASHRDFVDMTEDEIVDNMYGQCVIGARLNSLTVQEGTLLQSL